MYAPEDQKKLNEAFQCAVENGTSYDLELRLLNASGAKLWVRTTGKAEKMDGKIVRVSGNIIDITEHKQDEAKIIHVSRLYATISQINQAIVFSKDRETLFAEICRVAVVHGKFRMAWIGILDEAHGYVEAVVFAGEEQGYLKNVIINVYDPILSRGPTATAIRERRTVLCQDIANDPNMVPWREQAIQRGFLSSASVPIQKNGRPIGALAVYASESPGFSDDDQGLLDEIAKDISHAVDSLDTETKRKQAEEEIRQLNVNLEQRVAERTAELVKANRVKDEFLATMSHELRTPLNSILGMSEILLEQMRDPLSPYQQKSIQVIESSGSHLLELINDILDLSKVEAGKLDYFPEVIAVEAICRTSLAFVKEAAVKKSIALGYEPTLQISNMYADPRRLKQILINLLNNAVKFTPKNGTVTLQVTSDVERDRVQFSVMDTGIGIAAEDLKKLFKPFTQLDSRLNREYEGTGLGLALVQKLTNLHGGSVAVESEVGKGSRFTINLRWGKDMVGQQS
ncbi:MAG: ATP-binding protein, partial [Limisphaerales bacterium]